MRDTLIGLGLARSGNAWEVLRVAVLHRVPVHAGGGQEVNAIGRF